MRVKTLWQKAMPQPQPRGLLGAVAPVGQDTAQRVRDSTPGKQGTEQDQYFLTDLHLIIGALVSENQIFVHILEEERSLPTQRGYYTGVATCCYSCYFSARRKLQHCVQSLSNQSADFDLLVVFLKETPSVLRWHNCLQMQFYPLAGPNQMQTITLNTLPYSYRRILFLVTEWGNIGTSILNLTSKTH